jgi:hypothetical protein
MAGVYPIVIGLLFVCLVLAGIAAAFVWPTRVSGKSHAAGSTSDGPPLNPAAKPRKGHIPQGKEMKRSVGVDPASGVSNTRQLSLSDSGSNESGPGAVSPWSRSPRVPSIPTWPEARWSGVVKGNISKHALCLVLVVQSGSRRQKQCA